MAAIFRSRRTDGGETASGSGPALAHVHQGPDEAAPRDGATAAVFAGVVAATMALYYYNSTFGGLETAGRDTISGLSIAFFLIFSGHGFKVVVDRAGIRSVPSWLYSNGAQSLLWLVVLCLAGLVAPLLPVSPLPVFGILGALSCLSALRAAFRAPVRPPAVVAFLAFAAFSGLQMAWFVLHGQDVMLIEGGISRDTVYHAAVAGMIQTYGVASTGVDGVVYYPYHFGSHWVAARLASLTGGSLLDFYQSTFRMVTISFFVHALLGFVLALRERVYRGENRHAPPLHSDLLLWTLLYLGLIGIHQGFGVALQDDYQSSVLGSESFVLAQACAYSIFTLFLVFFRDRMMAPGMVAGRTPAVMPLCAWDWIALGIVLPLGLGAIGLMKISLMILTLPMVGWIFLRYGLFHRATLWIPMAASIFMAALVARVTSLWLSNPAQSVTLSMSSLASGYAAQPWQWSAVVAGAAFWPGMFIFSRLRHLRLGTFPEMFSALGARRLIDVEVVLLLSLAGFAPGALTRIAGGGQVYFTIVPIIASLAFFLACRGLGFAAVATMASTLRPLHRLRRARVEWAVVLFASAPFLLLVGGAAIRGFGTAEMTLSIMRQTFLLPFDCLTHDCWERRVQSRRKMVAHRPGPHRVFRLLNRLQQLPRGEKQRSLLFIPKETRAYWQGLNPRHGPSLPCLVRPFIAPAVSGLAMLDGRPEPGCPGAERAAYRLDGLPPVADMSSATICAAARQRGFARVWVIAPAGETLEWASLRVVECGGS
jgi:hypothetical protein